jgi:hypothetical protein
MQQHISEEAYLVELTAESSRGARDIKVGCRRALKRGEASREREIGRLLAAIAIHIVSTSAQCDLQFRDMMSLWNEFRI